MGSTYVVGATTSYTYDDASRLTDMGKKRGQGRTPPT